MCKIISRFGLVAGCLLLLLTTLGVAAFGQKNAEPFLNQPLVPTAAAPGGPGFTLTVNGTGFVSGSTVEWNGAALATQFVSASQLTATVPASDIAAPGTTSVTVSSPSPGGGASNPEFFSVATSRPAIALAQVFSDFGGSDSVVVADFNGDGKLDVAVNDQLGNTVAVSLGNGDGTFQPYKTYATGSLPYFLAAADLNHDGNMDLVVTDIGQNTVSVLLGNGDGTFQSHVDYAVGTLSDYQGSVAIADFNGDGNLDLAVCNPPDGTFSVLLGNGDGTFQPQLVTGADGATSLATGDFNRDGRLDLAIVASGGVEIWLGNGDGTFTDSSFVNAHSASAVVTADLNGDGKLDLAAADGGFGGNTLYVVLGNGDGTFQAPVAYATADFNGPPVVADFNGDGKLDLAVSGAATVTGTNNGPAVISTLLGNGDGTFQAQIEEPASTGFISLVAADFNGDGVMDIGTIGGVFLGTAAEFSPSIVDFGDVGVGVTSAPLAVMLTNLGSTALTVSNVTTSQDFAQTDNCGGSVAPGASCTINLTFTPTLVGRQPGSLIVTDSALGSPQSIDLSGVGQAPTVNLSPKSLLFADQKVGTKSPIQSVTFTNTGNASLSITGITASGEFLERSNCGSSLAAGGGCTISVIFGPMVSGTKTGTLAVTDNASGSPQTVSLTGTGIVFELSPSFLNFGSVVVGQTPSQNVTLTNSSPNAQTVGGIRLTGNHLGEFSQTNTCGTSLGAGATCTITVTFAPTKAGASNATLEVSGGGANQNVPVSGTGTQ